MWELAQTKLKELAKGPTREGWQDNPDILAATALDKMAAKYEERRKPAGGVTVQSRNEVKENKGPNIYAYHFEVYLRCLIL